MTIKIVYEIECHCGSMDCPGDEDLPMPPWPDDISAEVEEMRDRLAASASRPGEETETP